MEPANMINTYTCPECGWQIVTITRVEGVTPAFIRCEGRRCDVNTLPGAISAMYCVNQSLTPTHEWYRPDANELVEKPWALEHVTMGGLLLRKIGETA
jgi:hypothetical protein